jgi:acyl-CoA thioester hydrolase
VYTHALQPRFSDIDSYNHVNNAVYLTYFEEARVAFTHACGLRALYTRECSTILVHADIDYKKPAFLGDTLLIALSCSAVRNSSFEYTYAITREADAALIATGKTVQVCFNFVLNAPVRVPAGWRDVLQDHATQLAAGKS